MTPRKIAPKEAVTQIDDLISDWGKLLNDDEYLEALEEMENRARAAHDAREQELIDQEEDDDEDDEDDDDDDDDDDVEDD